MKTIVDYASKVKEQHALNKTLAPVETDLTDASRAYAIGEQFIYNGELFKAKTAIAQHDALVLNTNYEAADNLATEIEALTNQANDMVNVLGAKNLIPYPYHRQNGYTANGATFTYDDEGVITVNKVVGNSTAYFALFSNILYPDAEKFLEPNTSYILSMELENATDTSCFVQTQNGSDLAAIRNKTTGKYEISFTTTETVDSLAVALYYGAEKTENNAKVKLMIRLASINDSTYVPYAKTNRQLTAENQTLTNNVGVLIENGAVNLAENKGTTTTHRGITFTVNADGTVTASGTNDGTGDSTIILNQAAADHLETTGIYKLSGCPSGGSDSTYYLVVYQGGFGADDYGDGVVFTNNNYGSLKLACVVKSGTDLATDITFKPMIADANYSGDYVPYAKTNRELTEELAITDHWADAKVSGFTYFSGSYLKKYGSIVTLSFSVSNELPTGATTKVLALPEGCRPAGNFIVPAYVNGVVNGFAWIRANGDVEINPSTTGTYLGFTTTFIATQ